MAARSTKHYRLGTVRTCALEGRFVVTHRAQRYMAAQSWDSQRLAECLCALTRGDLHKSVIDPRRPEFHLDSYRPWVEGRRLYIKFTLVDDGDLYVLTFCRDGDDH